MTEHKDTFDDLLASLHERAKELECLYEIEGILGDADNDLSEVFRAVVQAVPVGLQFPEITRALITYKDITYKSEEFEPTDWGVCTEIQMQGKTVGTFCIYYMEDRPGEGDGPFLREEVRLLSTIADRLGHFILFHKLKALRQTFDEAESVRKRDSMSGWRQSLQLLRVSDKGLFLRISRKMLNHLYSLGIEEAKVLLQEADIWGRPEEVSGEMNVPGRRRRADVDLLLSDKPFEVAAEHLGVDAIMSLLQKWLLEDKAAFFINILANPRSSLNEISEAIRRYQHVVAEGAGLADPVIRGLRVSLARRFLTEQLDFLKVAKDFIKITDMQGLLERMILPPESHGKMGGKSAGLLLATSILENAVDPDRPVGVIKTPKTWYVASDEILRFMAYNDLEDVIEQKFKEIDQIRQEYPNVVQLFKDSSFPPEFIKNLSATLDDFGEAPLIIRSSSLLEDRLGTAFSGKYKSLFLANQGSKQERLDAALDAIAEVFASVFGPDPIEYRREHGLLEFSEEMGILIQEVVGRKVGRYYLPAFAGVAFSNNEFRWSPRIRREDGILRLVPGMGTRAVDRVGDDYPILIVPGQPTLRVNTAIDEVVRYSPKKVDVLNLESRDFETIDLEDLLIECGPEYPGFAKVFSVLKDGILQKPVSLLYEAGKDETVVTFNGLLTDTSLISHLGNILKILEEVLKSPVDIEFAHDGEHFYLLQCRPQSSTAEDAPAAIPKDVDDADVVFSANRFVSNGWMPDITHVVYVDPKGYGDMTTRQDMLDVARAVGKLNKLLPKRQFILMGPGRWGSRGDIKLGVSITYADISNTSMLIEMAMKKGAYVPDLSFGTHFFQDLVESRIRYLPLYPDDTDVLFNRRFLTGSPNLLAGLLPEFEHLQDVLRVIDVPATSKGRILRVLLNAELDEAMAMLALPDQERVRQKLEAETGQVKPAEEYWRWRLKMAEIIASQVDGGRFGVKAFYVFGSTKNASAGPSSDIDLLVHFRGGDQQLCELKVWLEGWSRALAEMNYLKTGYCSDGLLDVHIITDEDIERQDSFAIKIDAVTDAARELPIGKMPQ